MTGHKRFRGGWVIAAVLLPILLMPAQAAAQAPEVFDGILVSNAAGAAGLASIRIEIDEYTTDEEALEFIDVLASEGWEALESRFIREEEKGRFIRNSQLGLDIAFARSIPHETGRIVRLATARPIQFAEARYSSRSRDYAFGIIELRLDEEGQGSGVVIAAAKVEFNDEGQLEIESFGDPPFSITTIEVRD